GGIGRVYAKALAEAGCGVVAADLGAGADDVAGEISAAGGSALAVKVDVSDRRSAEAMAAQALQRFGRIDGLVNNAAYYTAIVKKDFTELTYAEWDRCFAVNVRGAWLCARAVTAAMKRQRAGKIVNVSSMTVPTAPPGFAHYISSKAAIIGLTRALARELGEHGICVNTLTPDYIAFDRDYDNRQPEMRPMLTAQRCFRRDAGADDLIGTLLYLLGPGSDFVTGQDIWVNGGGGCGGPRAGGGAWILGLAFKPLDGGGKAQPSQSAYAVLRRRSHHSRGPPAACAPRSKVKSAILSRSTRCATAAAQTA